jgi:hypothetical protein
MMMTKKNITKVGMGEFRTHMPQYLMTSSPVAITRHGETIGFYIPTRHQHNENDLDALKKAALKLEKLLISQGITEEELFAEFHALRERNKD